MPFKSDSGGFDFGPIELSILFEEFGKFLVLEPYLSNIVLSGFILDNSNFDKKKMNIFQNLFQVMNKYHLPIWNITGIMIIKILVAL